VPLSEEVALKKALALRCCVLLLAAGPAFAQSAREGPGDYGDERRWAAEHPEALQALGSMSKEELGQFLSTYQSLSPEEKAELREHAGELQQLGPGERSWALQNPDAVRQLGAMSDEQREKFLKTYQGLSAAEQKNLREHANELQNLSPEEQNWALDHPDAVRQLGTVPDGDRAKMMDAYRNMSPETQKLMRDQMGR
jgi:hypothetical protein